MPKKTQWIWYRTNEEVKAAFLFNCRKQDLWDGAGIKKGMVIEGTKGFVVAELDVPEVSGKVVPFQANRRCEWQGLELSCLAKANAPAGQPVPRDDNYIIAHLDTDAARQLAAACSLPVVRGVNGEHLVNLEISRFKNQDKNRRATLI